jgi:hypothetical protein
MASTFSAAVGPQAIADPPKAAIGNPVEGVLQASKVNANFLLEMIVCDVHMCALQVATLSMMISAASRPGARVNLRSCRYLLSDDVKVMLLAIRYGEEVGLDARASESVSALYRSIDAAKTGLTPLIQTATPAPSQRKLLQNQSAIWARIAEEASVAIHLIEAQVKTRLNRLYSDDAETLRRYLKRAANGDASEVDDSGVAHPPKLKQRRQSPRVSVNRACTLVLPSGSIPARLIDVSLEGMQVSCDQPLTKGQKLVVETDDGERRNATVVRAHGTKFGLSLSLPLSRNNPLFKAAESPPRH